jgi:oligo-1,6-glucosidase
METQKQLFMLADKKRARSTISGNHNGFNRRWWKEAVVYQVYPRSFKDTNNDGVGDINGIISELDYLKQLGVDVIWLSPVYKSPNGDNGYDISDYCDINEEFGTMADWERMLEEIHKRGMKLVMDLVLNHTSDQHPWFIQSRSSKDNPYRDFYIWRPPRNDGREPNNWVSFFGGSTWQFDSHTGEYYLHLFSGCQPDLNWENPRVREEIYKMIKFWLDKGVDGFRMDVINVISKVPELPDAAVKDPEEMYHWAGEHFFNGPKLVEYLRELKKKVLDHYDIFTVGETPDVTPQEGQMFTCEHEGVLDMLFQFELMVVDVEPGKQKWCSVPWKLSDIKDVMTRWQVGLSTGWNSLYLENHDQPRSVSRFGNDTDPLLHRYSAKMLATWLHMFKGTPYVYQGEEIGMTNVKFASINDYRDVESHNYYRYEKERGVLSESEIMERLHHKSRDNARTPMQWNGHEPYAGFSQHTPWIQVNPNHKKINVEKSQEDSQSILKHYQRLIQLRKEHLIAVYGDYQLLAPDHPQVYAYLRTLNQEQLLVIANFSAQSIQFNLSAEDQAKILHPLRDCEVLIQSYQPSANNNKIPFDPQQAIDLPPYEAIVYKLIKHEAQSS